MIGRLPKFAAGTELGLEDAVLRELVTDVFGGGWVLLQVGGELASMELITADGIRHPLGGMASRLVEEEAHRNGARSLGAHKRGKRPTRM